MPSKNVYPIFSAWLLARGFVAEHKFLPDRKFRFDFAHLDLSLAIEIQGGIWMGKGAHNTGKAIIRDIEKFNLAKLAGWELFLVHPGMLSNGEAYSLVDKVLGMQNAKKD